MPFLNLLILKKRIFAIKPMLKDPSVSIWKKAIIVAGLIYLFLPIDLIPPFVPVFGFLDDLILWGFIISYLKDELDKYWNDGLDGESYSGKFKGKNIVDDVDFTIKGDDQEEQTEK